MGAVDDVDPADLEAYHGYARALVDAVEDSLAAWVTRLVDERSRGVDRSRLDEAIDEVRATVLPALRDFEANDPGRQTTTPLAILRRGVRPVTELLRAAGVPPARRDEMEVRLAPEDVYGLGPAAFADLGDAVGAAGLEWGAATAHVHLRRRRAAGSG